MPATATGGCMFILLTCHRLGGGGGFERRKEKKEKRLNVCVHAVTCERTYTLKYTHSREAFRDVYANLYFLVFL